MLYRADIGGTRPLVLVDAPTLVTPVADARHESFERFSNLELGKQMMSEILSRFDDGSFLVKLSTTAARMNLPEGTKVGDSIPLTLVSRDPRPTFLLGQQASGATAKLSSTARLIGNLLQAAQQEGAPAGLVGKAALLPSPAGLQPAPLASTLHDTLVYSGLFYESHVAQWALGARSRADLMREPQARFTREQQSPPTTETAPQTPALPARRESGHLQIDPQTGALIKVAAPQRETEIPMQPVLEPEAARLVSLQLDTLEKSRVVWQGNLWPGQPLEWEVSEETPKGYGHAGAEEKIWRSTLRLALPSLGQINATVQLTGQDVQVHLRAGSEEAIGMLRARGGELAAALQQAGTRLNFMGVSLNGTA